MILPELSEIRERRRSLMISQAILSRVAGISQGALSKIERGESDPSYSTVKGLFGFFSTIEREAKTGTVEKIMTKNVVKVEEGTRVSDAARLMRGQGLSQLPVFRGRIAIGSVSEKSIIAEIEKAGFGSAYGKKVEEVMLPPFPVVPEGSPTKAVFGILENFSAVLISSKKDGSIVGIVSRADVLRMG